ncbi:MAG: hypothetical protein H6612_03815 [Ignavibacteriales bacterium]|nr:hypothetical protein [Ignavibacteriales bacterium]
MKLFQNERINALKSLKIGDYIWYALGEIFFIFIGIYLAIWFDDYTTFNKNRELEQEILKEIQNNLIYDEEGIVSDIQFMIQIDENLDSLNTNLNEKKIYNKIMDKQFAALIINPHFNPNRSGYEYLLSQGIELILNDTLRRAITNLYESTYDYYQKYENERRNFVKENIETKLISNFTLIDSENDPLLKPQKYNDLLTNTEFFSLLSFAKVKNLTILKKAINVKKEIQILSKIIQENISK